MSEKRKIEAEVDFKDMLKNPHRLFGLFYIIVYMVILAGGIYYVKHLDQIAFNRGGYTVPDIDLSEFKKVERKKGGVKPAIDLSLLKQAGEEDIKKGKELFVRNCSACHGTEGKGDGPAGAALNPKPRDFTKLEGWKNGPDIVNLYKTLQEGVAGTGMTAYEFLPPTDRISIIHYIRTLADYPPVTDSDIKKLDEKYQLSKGIVEPSTVPLPIAMNKISDEEKSILKKKDDIVEKVINDNSGEALLLKKVAKNLDNVIYLFASHKLSGNFDDFLGKIAGDPVTYGFSSSVLRLSKGNLKALFDYLTKLAG